MMLLILRLLFNEMMADVLIKGFRTNPNAVQLQKKLIVLKIKLEVFNTFDEKLMLSK